MDDGMAALAGRPKPFRGNRTGPLHTDTLSVLTGSQEIRGNPKAIAEQSISAFGSSGECRGKPAWPGSGLYRHRCGRGRREQPAASPCPQLYPSVPEAAERNPALGELLALFDAVRGGSAREQALALTLLEERLQP